MKIHITKDGKIAGIICFIIIVVLFLMFGVPKIVENHKVNSLPSVANVFSNSDISYNDWSSLKSSFRAQHAAVSNLLQKANELKQSYPQNDALASKIQNYSSYLSSMEATFAKIEEDHRVNLLPSVADVFSNSDISYNDWSSLKSSFRARYAAVSNLLQKANELKQSYPQNDALAKKIQSYGSYLSSMNEASFECPEHINTCIERRYRTCSKCNGTGKRLLVLKCEECDGTGKIPYDVEIVINCPHCGTTYKSQISGNSLLN